MTYSPVNASGKKRIVVVCPGRGSYTAETLGYLKSYRPVIGDFLDDMDQRRASIGEPTITELDSKEKFSPSLHTRGEHASALIYSCSYADFMAIDRSRYEIVAICGNSMGWYLALAFSGALDWAGGFHVIQTMGSMMKEHIIGGQLIYPVVDDNWHYDPLQEEMVAKKLSELRLLGAGEAYISIRLGGYVVIGGEKTALDYLQKNLPKRGDYPFQLINHAAFHTPLLFETSEKAFGSIPFELFQKPHVPLIDGNGKIWTTYGTDVYGLYDYTLGEQVFATYNFTSSIEVALKEFLPDHLVLLGPGGSLGGAIGQILVANNWKGIKDKASFSAQQKSADPVLLSMGLPDQKKLVVI